MSEPTRVAEQRNTGSKGKPLQEKSGAAPSTVKDSSPINPYGAGWLAPNQESLLYLAPMMGNERIVGMLECSGPTLRERAAEQWKANPKAHQFFRNFEHYVTFLPMYETQFGISNPAEYLAKNIVRIDVFGKLVTVHQALADRLLRAEDNLTIGKYGTQQTTQNKEAAATGEQTAAGEKQKSFKPKIHQLGGLSIRSKRGQEDKLSMHALGLAIDIDAPTNPMIRRKLNKQLKQRQPKRSQGAKKEPKNPESRIDAISVIFEITGVDMAKAASVEQLRSANDSFKQKFNQAWIDQQSPEMQASLKSDTALRSQLDEYATEGFLNLDQPLIDALTEVGLTWGGSWKSSKDFMHFELEYSHVQ